MFAALLDAEILLLLKLILLVKVLLPDILIVRGDVHLRILIIDVLRSLVLRDMKAALRSKLLTRKHVPGEGLTDGAQIPESLNRFRRLQVNMRLV